MRKKISETRKSKSHTSKRKPLSGSKMKKIRGGGAWTAARDAAAEADLEDLR